MNLFWNYFYKSLMTAFMFTSFFLIMNYVDHVLEKKGIIGHNKLYVLVPVQFIMIIVVYMCMMYVAHWFKLV